MMRVFLLGIALLATAAAQEAEAPDDAAITARVQEMVTKLEGYEDVTVAVSGGVVQLNGTVLDTQKRQRLETAVTELEGVTAVDNQLEINLELQSRLPSIAEELAKRLRQAYQLLPLLIIALGIVVASWFVSRLIANSGPLLKHFTRSPAVRNLVAQLGSLIAMLVGLVLALDVLGATALVGGVLGAAGVLGIALGFAFKDLIENYIASLMLSVRQPFKPDDLVRIDEHEGVVARLTSRSTVLIDLNGNRLRLPNSLVFKSVIVNYTSAPERRFEFDVGVGYDVDLQHAQKIAIDTLLTVPGVLKSPGPVARVCNLGDSTITLRIMAWVNQDDSSFRHVRSQALIEIKRVFDEHDIDMPEPIYNLRMLPETRAQTPTRAARESSTESLDQTEDQQADFVLRQVQAERAQSDGENLIDDQTATE